MSKRSYYSQRARSWTEPQRSRPQCSINECKSDVSDLTYRKNKLCDNHRHIANDYGISEEQLIGLMNA